MTVSRQHVLLESSEAGVQLVHSLLMPVVANSFLGSVLGGLGYELREFVLRARQRMAKIKKGAVLAVNGAPNRRQFRFQPRFPGVGDLGFIANGAHLQGEFVVPRSRISEQLILRHERFFPGQHFVTQLGVASAENRDPFVSGGKGNSLQVDYFRFTLVQLHFEHRDAAI